MSDEPVAVVLASVGLERHIAAFVSEGVALKSDLILLSDTDMKEIGINIGERNRLKRYLSNSQHGFLTTKPNPMPTFEERDRYIVTFRAIDEDGNGEVDFDEFVGALKKLEMYQSDIESRHIFNEADKDKGGTLDLEEFVQLLHNAKGGRTGQMSRLARAGHDILSKLNKKSGLTISMEDVFNTEMTDTALEEVNRLLDDSCFSWMPSVSDCDKNSCAFLFNLLILDLDLIKQFVSTACAVLLGGLESQLREIGEHELLFAVDTNAVELDSIRILVIIFHRYAHQSPLAKDSMTSMDMQFLHGFRKTAVLVACDKGFQNVREALVEHLKRQRVARNSSPNYANYASSFVGGVAKGATSSVAGEMAMGALEAGCSIM
mmetsp:Transcript_19813/g.57491  ORF Transcript_19813/g.57491 Transcript_19813/m.57491 type:complete len:376 (-) Transcript_19813:490-1617(-)|eukprot:CAMPEP_0113568948 /NCGR_PEP_ID=MMETSP0015_2-20120614/24130_1 /TAXON_ID=2838 /ORGANISM="Odontella" /LENGTH=375 /DNA_ID=CAMNT_0000471541 /DNA_START=69 /DNA_END=1196 /DNA_ORIENTATION=+ /assembly_acc=CAM_ASM_000160